MTVTEEQLTAYADGELSDAEANRIGMAIAADPALSARLDAERRLRAMLGSHLDPVAAEPVPERLTLMMATLAAQEAEAEMTDAAPVPAPSRVFDLAGARARRVAAAGSTAPASPRKRALPRGWGMSLAIAASLLLGVGMGVRLPREGARTAQDGKLIATGSLARGLEKQLASAQDAGSPSGLRILNTFRRQDAGYCRVYQDGATSGIACKDGGDWILERTVLTGTQTRGNYRQAGSAASDLMAAAQDMSVGTPLDALQERTARARQWSTSR